MKVDPLYELIHSLSANEKRYFKLYSRLQDSKHSQEYLQLFELIAAQSAYDELVLQRKLRNKTFAKNLATSKNYLYNLILKCLRSYQTDQRSLFRILHLIQDTYILFEKNLLQQAGKRLRKAKKEAVKHDYALLLLEILKFECVLIRAVQDKRSDETLQRIHREMEACLQQIDIEAQSTIVYDKIFLVRRNQSIYDDANRAILQLIEQYSRNIRTAQLGLKNQLYYHLIWSSYYLGDSRQIKEAQYHLQAMLDAYEQAHYLIEEHTLRYINVVNNYLNTYLLEKDFSPFPHYISQLEQLKPKTELQEVNLFQTIHYLKLRQYLSGHAYQKALALVDELEQGLQQYGDRIGKNYRMQFVQDIGLVYFHNREYDRAIEYLHQIIHDRKHEIRQDVQLFCRLLQLMAHYELNHMELVTSLGRSLVRSQLPADHPYIPVVKAVVHAAGQPEQSRREILEQVAASWPGHHDYLLGEDTILAWLHG